METGRWRAGLQPGLVASEGRGSGERGGSWGAARRGWSIPRPREEVEVSLKVGEIAADTVWSCLASRACP